MPCCSDQYIYIRFSRCKIPRSMAYTISEKAIWFQRSDYNLDRAQKLISSSMSRHLWTCSISSKSMHASRHATFHPNPCMRFWVILLTDRQTDRKTPANALTSTFVGGKKTKVPTHNEISSEHFWSQLQLNSNRSINLVKLLGVPLANSFCHATAA